MKQLSIIAALLFSGFSGYGQHHFGLKINGGVSHISNNIETNKSRSENFWAPSAQAGVFYSYGSGKNFTFGTELYISQIQGRGRLESTAMDTAGNTYRAHADIANQITYLSLPAYFSFNIQRMGVNLGFQGSWALASSGTEKGQGPDSSGEITEFENAYDDIHISSFDFGPRVGFTFRLTENLSMEGNYYYGMTNISRSKAPQRVLTVQQATVGIRYTLL